MDQFTRRIIGFGVRAGVLDGLAICRMFNRAIAGRGLTAAACISYPWLRDLPEFATDTLRRRSLPTVSGMICSTAGHGLARGTPALHHRGGGIVQRTAFAGFAMDLC